MTDGLNPRTALSGRTLGLLATGVLLTTCQPLVAQSPAPDRVQIRLSGSNGRISLAGTIVDFTIDQLHFRSANSRTVKRYPTADVFQVETPHNPDHARGLREFSRHNTRDALRSFQAALSLETRPWVRRDLLAMLVRCHTNQRDLLNAGVRFSELIRSQTRTRHYPTVPLVWSPTPLTPALKQRAILWLGDDTPFIKIMGGSLLLDDPEQSRLARGVLQELVTCVDRRVRELARFQSWRLRLQDEPPSDALMQSWATRIIAAPDPVRAGGYYLLGRGHWLRGEFDRAAVGMLWVPLVYNGNHQLAARACLEAADALVECGRKTEATVLYREVMQRYPTTPFARDAQSTLNSGLKRAAETTQ
ncbi:MAG: hypothetical protein ABGZ17_17930 [Planctomycetaceae bacterium]